MFTLKSNTSCYLRKETSTFILATTLRNRVLNIILE